MFDPRSRQAGTPLVCSRSLPVILFVTLSQAALLRGMQRFEQLHWTRRVDGKRQASLRSNGWQYLGRDRLRMDGGDAEALRGPSDVEADYVAFAN